MALVRKKISLSLDESKALVNSVANTATMPPELTMPGDFDYTDLFNNMHSAVAIFDAVGDGEDFTFKDLNLVGQRIEKLKIDDIRGKSVLEIFPGIREFGLLDVFQRIWRTGISEHFPLARYEDQRIKGWRDNYVSKLPDGTIISIYDDFTGRIQMESDLQLGGAKYKMLFDAFPMAVTISDKEGNIVECNKLAEILLGLSREEQLQRRIDGNEWHIIKPDGSTWPVDEYASVVALKEKRTAENKEMGIVKSDGSITWIDVVAQPVSIDGLGIVITYQDVTARKNGLEALRQSELRYSNLVENTGAGIASVDLEGRLTFVNGAFSDLLGYKVNDVVGRPFADFVHPGDLPETAAAFLNAAMGIRIITNLEFRLKHKNERELWFTANPTAITDGEKIIGFTSIVQEITDRKNIERQKELSLKVMELLNRAEDQQELIRTILVLIKEFSGCEAVGIRLTEGDDCPYYETNGFIPGHVEIENSLCASAGSGEIVRDSNGNAMLECMCGNIIQGRFDPALTFFSEGGSFWSNCTTELLATTSDKDRQTHTRNRCNKEGYESVALIPLKSKKGNIGLLQMNDTRRGMFSLDTIKYFEGIAQSIEVVLTRNKTEQALQKSEENFRNSFNNSPLGIRIVTEDGETVYVNSSLLSIYGYSSLEEFKSIPSGERYTAESYAAYRERADKRKNGDSVPPNYNVDIIRKDGEVRHLSVSRGNVLWGGKMQFQVIYNDITELKRTEKMIVSAKTLLQTVIDSSPDRIAVKDLHHRYLLVNKSLSDAVKVQPQEMIGMLDTEIFSAEQIYGNPARGMRSIHDDDNEAMKGNVVRAISSTADIYGKEQVFDAYRIPLKDAQGNIYGVLAYNRDITDIHNKTEELKSSYQKIQKTLRETVEAIALICETRDPYTAGHQIRVARLAFAIASAMGLPEQSANNIETGGTLHDIGKMYIPAEILSKPSRLTDIEFAMIRNHSQVGYDIIHKINFPAPVAQMILQHHERLDGSGYPGGLKEPQIIIEAKILAVADVVEAMSSHRPYRPALGTGSALEEISRNKGRLYDPQIVDICCSLFTENKFKFD